MQRSIYVHCTVRTRPLRVGVQRVATQHGQPPCARCAPTLFTGVRAPSPHTNEKALVKRTGQTHPAEGATRAGRLRPRYTAAQPPPRGRTATQQVRDAGSEAARGVHPSGALCGAPRVWRRGGGGTLASCGAPRVRGGQAQVAHVWAWDDTAHRMIGGRARPARGERPTPRVDRVGPRPKSWGWTDQRRRDGAGRVHPRVDQRRGRSIYRPRG